MNTGGRKPGSDPRRISLLLACAATLLISPVWAAEPAAPVPLPSWKPSEKASRSINDRLFSLPPSFYEAVDAGSRARPWLGVTLKEVPGPEGVASPALEILNVFPQSPADAAGLRAGDRIVGFKGQRLEKGEVGSVILNFLKGVQQAGNGTTVPVEVWRGGATSTFEARLDARPSVTRSLAADVGGQTPVGGESLAGHLLESSGRTGDFEKTLAAMGRRADEVVSTAVRGEDFNPFQLNTVNALLHRPLALAGAGRSLAERLNAGMEGGAVRLDGLAATGAAALDLILEEESTPDAPPGNWTAYLDRLIKKITALQERHREVLSRLGADEIERVEQWFVNWMRGLGKPEKELSTAQKKKAEAMTLAVLNTALKADLRALLQEAHALARAIDVPHLRQLAREARRVVNIPQGWVGHREPDRWVYRTPAGKVIVGGAEHNEYREDAVLILDFGGDDTYRNRAGGARPGLPFAVVIDLEGNDRYESAEPFSQGAGFLGAGFLIDLAGDDTYTADVLAQGTGILGAGVLFDGGGRDRYLCRAFCQASAGWGLGFLVETEGYDIYQADLYAQGLGFVKGFAALVDGGGNDHYFAGGLERDHRQPDKATLSMAQGFGLGLRPWESVAGASGGIGILSDIDGNDTYSADYFAQGASYWLALGVLHDGGGHDRYLAGRYAQGAGVHFSLGLLNDVDGDDQYQTHFGVSQGCGHDFGVGWLEDRAGDDLYVSGVMAQGAGNANGLGILTDTGGRDRYFVGSEGQGRGPYEPMRELGSFGFFIDTGGGEDRYFPDGGDGRLLRKGDYGFFADVE